MSELVIANKSDLVTVADAIREKAGIEDGLAFPEGFAEAIAAIEAGEIPSNITEIAGGTLTMASDQRQHFAITHNMGKPPSVLVLWSASTNQGNMGWGIIFPNADLGIGWLGSAKGISFTYANRGSSWTRNGMANTSPTTIVYPALENSGTSAKAGDTFYWLAWVV